MEELCKVCGNIWKTRKEKPNYCPKCKSKFWNLGYNLKCEICKRTCFIPLIHHINGKHKDERKENRILLCIDCHSIIHNGFRNTNKRRSGRRKYFPPSFNLRIYLRKGYDIRESYGFILKKLKTLRIEYLKSKNGKTN